MMVLRGLVQERHRQDRTRQEVHIGLAAGLSMRQLAQAFADLLCERAPDLPARIIFHAMVTGHEPDNPTTDPNEAINGSLVSAGGHKGYGLGLMVEVLAAAMTGSNLSRHIAPLKAPEGPPHNIGQFYLVVDPQAFAADGFYEQLTELGELVAEQPGARLPGSTRSQIETVEVDDETWGKLQHT